MFTETKDVCNRIELTAVVALKRAVCGVRVSTRWNRLLGCWLGFSRTSVGAAWPVLRGLGLIFLGAMQENTKEFWRRRRFAVRPMQRLTDLPPVQISEFAERACVRQSVGGGVREVSRVFVQLGCFVMRLTSVT